MDSLDLNERIRLEIETGVKELLGKANLEQGDIFVLGCSTSEIQGYQMGSSPSEPLGVLVIKTLLDVLQPRDIELAVQGSEHINRAILVEREVAKKRNLEIVSVIPSINAGGSAQVAAFQLLKNPVEVEHIEGDAGMDIGDTFIGMHVRFVQISVRTSIKNIGRAHVSFIRSKPKYIGGERAIYHKRTQDLPSGIIPMTQ